MRCNVDWPVQGFDVQGFEGTAEGAREMRFRQWEGFKRWLQLLKNALVLIDDRESVNEQTHKHMILIAKNLCRDMCDTILHLDHERGSSAGLR